MGAALSVYRGFDLKLCSNIFYKAKPIHIFLYFTLKMFCPPQNIKTKYKLSTVKAEFDSI